MVPLKNLGASDAGYKMIPQKLHVRVTSEKCDGVVLNLREQNRGGRVHRVQRQSSHGIVSRLCQGLVGPSETDWLNHIGGASDVLEGQNPRR
jgi:hypothetical protein